MPMPNEKKTYTYADLLTWPTDEKWEIINGTPYLQAAPTWQHQAISVELISQFNSFLKGKPCRVFASPFDLRLPQGEEDDEDVDTVIQPDITVVCDKSRLKGTGYNGVPALIIEIVSPASSKMDRLYKFNKYEEAGIWEYWLVEPDVKLVSVFTLQENKRYGRPDTYTDDDTINVKALPGLIIDLNTVFAAI